MDPSQAMMGRRDADDIAQFGQMRRGVAFGRTHKERGKSGGNRCDVRTLADANPEETRKGLFELHCTK